MSVEKLDRVKQDSIELLETLLSNKTLITFEINSKIVNDFTSYKNELVNKINSLTTIGDNAIQYEMGSDVLFEASVASISYDGFQIVDYIDNRYFEVDSIILV